KFSPNGTPLWTQRLGDEGTNPSGLGGPHVAVDAGGNVYLTGTFAGTAAFGGTTLTSLGATDVFVAKLNAAGNFQWAQQMGDNDPDYYSGDHGANLAIDASGNVYTTGHFSTRGAFISRHDPNGIQVWLKTMGGAGSGWGYGLAVDSASNVYATGQYIGTVDF